jgi:hypothetical protein
MRKCRETWFRVCRWGNEITPVLISGETSTQVEIDGRRRAKRTDYESICPTWDDAKNALVDDLRKKVAADEHRLARVRAELEAALKLRDD